MDGGVGAGTGDAALSPFPIESALGNSSLRAGAGVEANNTEPASEPCKKQYINNQNILKNPQRNSIHRVCFGASYVCLSERPILSFSYFVTFIK